MAAAQMLAHMGDMTRKIYLCDTFQGMSEPSDHDIELHSGKTADELLGDRSKNESYMAYASLEEVKNNMDRCAYPKDLITYVKGPVEETLENIDTGPIALLRLDTDWYESTACELEQLFPRLVEHDILIIDDYGHFAGAKKAVDEFVAKQGKPIFLHRIDYSARLIVKTSGLSQTGRPD